MQFEICLEALRVSAIIGILPNERTKAQDLEVDLRVRYEMDCFGESYDSPCNDEVSGESIVDYAILREIILTTFKNNQFLYLENALVAIQSEILARFTQIITLDLVIKKLEIFSDCVPKVCLKWAKND